MRWLDGITDSMDVECEQALGLGDGQGSLPYCSPWGYKESDITLGLNNSNWNSVVIIFLSRQPGREIKEQTSSTC